MNAQMLLLSDEASNYMSLPHGSSYKVGRFLPTLIELVLASDLIDFNSIEKQ